MAMVTSRKKSGSNDKVAITGWKLPFLDLYLVPGARIRKQQEVKKIRAKIMVKLLFEIQILKMRLKRLEG